MKKLLSLLSFLTIASILTAQVNLNQGLLMHLPFDGSISDISPNGLTVNQFGNPSFTMDKFNNPGAALNFNGSAYLEVSTPNGELSPKDSMSFALRFRTNSTAIQTLFTNVDFNSNTKKEYQIAINWSTHPGALFGVEASVNNASCVSLGPYTDYVSTGTSTINQNTWYCLAGTYDGDSMRIYLDGMLMHTKELNNEINDCGNMVMRIGRWASFQDQYFNGDLDEFRIYNRALNIDEIGTLCDYYQFPESTKNIKEVVTNFTLSPNPTSDYITIDFEKTIVQGTVTISDITGRILKTKLLNKTNTMQLNISNLPSNLYYLTIKTNEGTVTKLIGKE